MGMAQILIRLNVSRGLADVITIRCGQKVYRQEVDYEGIPFRCGRCHSYGHLGLDYAQGSMRQRWVHKDKKDAGELEINHSSPSGSHQWLKHKQQPHRRTLCEPLPRFF
jgi:hypothetical protein